MAGDLNELSGGLVAEQLRHTIDLLRAENAALRVELNHFKEISEQRLAPLEEAAKDHELRLRTLTDSATQFKVLAGLSTGGGLLSLISLLRLFAS
jgi:regulator of replication initiation timing